MFRVTNRGKEIGNAESIEDVRRIVEGQPAGRYDVDERPSDRFPDGDNWLAWGHLIRHADGRSRRIAGLGRRNLRARSG